MESPYGAELASIEKILEGFRSSNYVCSREIATTLFLAHQLGKPILVEGPAGVGKTELAKAASRYLKIPMIRLQCYEGLDETKSLYEWKYGKQLLYTQILKDKLSDVLKGAKGLKASMENLRSHEDLFFSKDFLEPRPLLKALQQKRGAVLLVDEVDKSDQEFEAFLLEVLSDYQVSIPEIGTIKALTRPFAFLTSNNTREMSEALKRRCLHLFIPFPDPKLEREIVRVHVPGIQEDLLKQLVGFVQRVREQDLKKVPSLSETIDWAKVLVVLHAKSLDPDLIKETLNVLIKFEDDMEIVRDKLYQLTGTIP